MSLACGAVAAPNGLVVLLTDYGADSIYVGELKGAIYSEDLETRIDTLTNSVPDFDIVAGAYLLAEGCAAYPKGTTFCCVVDPGVGTERKCVVLETKAGQFFVAPDNGLLGVVAKAQGVARLHEATNRAYWRDGVESATFHGRDIFGPVSACIAVGGAITEAGPKLAEMVEIPVAESRIEDGVAYGVILRSDPYGNLVTNLRKRHLDALSAKPGDRLTIRAGGHEYTAPYVLTYAKVPQGERLVLIQSAGFVELAINQGSLKAALGAEVHQAVSLRP